MIPTPQQLAAKQMAQQPPLPGGPQLATAVRPPQPMQQHPSQQAYLAQMAEQALRQKAAQQQAHAAAAQQAASNAVAAHQHAAAAAAHGSQAQAVQRAAAQAVQRAGMPPMYPVQTVQRANPIGAWQINNASPHLASHLASHRSPQMVQPGRGDGRAKVDRGLVDQRALAQLKLGTPPPPESFAIHATAAESRRARLENHDAHYTQTEWMKELWCDCGVEEGTTGGEGVGAEKALEKKLHDSHELNAKKIFTDEQGMAQRFILWEEEKKAADGQLARLKENGGSLDAVRAEREAQFPHMRWIPHAFVKEVTAGGAVAVEATPPPNVFYQL